MVDIHQQAAPRSQGGLRPLTRQKAAHKARLEAIRKNYAVPRVRVEPTREAFRLVLKHPNGMAFRSSGSVEWPLDRFTQRRLADGSVKIAEKNEKTERSAHERHSSTHHTSSQ